MKIILLILLLPFIATAYIPSKNSNEFRLVMDIDTLSIEGQMLSKKFLNPKIHVGGVFKLGEKESKMGASVTYAINPIAHITFAGDINQQKALGGAVWVHTHHKFLNGELEVLPFISIDKKSLGSLGVVVYKKLYDIDVHIGFKIRPFNETSSGIQIIIGTVFIGDILPQVLGGDK